MPSPYPTAPSCEDPSEAAAGQTALRNTLEEREAHSPFRPAQFLGTKTRVLPALLEAVDTEVVPGGTIVDLFTGSSVVAQGLAGRGYRVRAYDSMAHCVEYARALLGVGRNGSHTPLTAASLLDAADDGWTNVWEGWLQRERAAVAAEDADALIEISASLPQVWRPAEGSSALGRRLGEFRPGRRIPGIVSAHYAGTYFGIQQAIEIDRIRCGIEALDLLGELDPWSRSVALTALLAASSECVFSAGKHYAQPHRIRTGKDLTFIRGRIIQDRRKSISELFEARIQAVRARGFAPDRGHHVEKISMEGLSDRQALPEVAAIYADPPYTAQQYSRFYHVPEVIVEYAVPELQRVKGEVTRGLYPTGRFKSRFCSRREAPQAFRDLCRLASDRDATLILSYSFSQGESGNPRSIDLPRLREILATHFRSITEREIALTYRQFNAASVATSRNDTELLLIARPT
jgi:adenine-specific DNA-methyltransferase